MKINRVELLKRNPFRYDVNNHVPDHHHSPLELTDRPTVPRHRPLLHVHHHHLLLLVACSKNVTEKHLNLHRRPVLHPVPFHSITQRYTLTHRHTRSTPLYPLRAFLLPAHSLFPITDGCGRRVSRHRRPPPLCLTCFTVRSASSSLPRSFWVCCSNCAYTPTRLHTPVCCTICAAQAPVRLLLAALHKDQFGRLSQPLILLLPMKNNSRQRLRSLSMTRLCWRWRAITSTWCISMRRWTSCSWQCRRPALRRCGIGCTRAWRRSPLDGTLSSVAVMSMTCSRPVGKAMPPMCTRFHSLNNVAFSHLLLLLLQHHHRKTMCYAWPFSVIHTIGSYRRSSPSSPATTSSTARMSKTVRP